MRCWCRDPVQSQGGGWKMRSCLDVIPAFSFQCSAFDGACPLSCQDDVSCPDFLSVSAMRTIDGHGGLYLSRHQVLPAISQEVV